MNIMHFINNLDREGAQVMVSNLVTAADKTQINYIVCVRQPGGALVAILREQGVCVIEPPKYYGFKSLPRSVNFLKQVCHENEIHLIHAHMADAAVLSWLVARKLNLPMVISHHGHDILLKCNVICRMIYFVLLNLAARYAAMNIAVSASVAEQVKKILYVNRQKIQVISNGVHVPEKSQLNDKKEKYQNYKQSLTLVSVGRLVPLKGQCQLIHAVKKLTNYFPQVSLYIIGGGKMEKELKQLAQDEGVEKNIEFTGAVDDVSAYLAKADLYVSSSLSEGMPVSVLEAMAWQLPVVASDIPGNRSVVKPDETGFLYELNNINDLVSTIVAVVKDTAGSLSVASSARTMVERQYSAAESERAHEKLYMNISG